MSSDDKMDKKYGDLDAIINSDAEDAARLTKTRKKPRRVLPVLSVAKGENSPTTAIDKLHHKLSETESALDAAHKKFEQEKREIVKQHEEAMTNAGSAKPFVLTMPVTKQKVDFVAKEIDPELIDVSPENERIQDFLDEISLHDILPSIKSDGQQKPGTVRPTANGRYELIEGSRRLAAVKLAKKKYITFVGDVPDADVRDLSEIENTHKDVSAYEKALSFDQQIKGGRYRSWNQLGAAKGISESHIHRYKDCAELPQIFVSILLSPSDMPLSYGETIRSLLRKNESALMYGAKELLTERNADKAIESKMDIDGVIKYLKSSVRTKADTPKAKKPAFYSSRSGVVLKHSVTSKGDAKFELKGVDSEKVKKISEYLIKMLDVN